MSKWPYTGIYIGGAVTEKELDMRNALNMQWHLERAALQLRLQRRPACVVDCAYCSGDDDCAQAWRDQRVLSADTDRDRSTPAWRLLGRLIFAASAVLVIALAFATV